MEISPEEAFRRLGLAPGATLPEVRAARRKLALEQHPDRHAGDLLAGERMREINLAFDRAVRWLLHPEQERPRQAASNRAGQDKAAAASNRAGQDKPAAARRRPGPRGERVFVMAMRPRSVAVDVSSFVIDALPVEAFEALVVITGWFGEVLDDEPPYVLEAHFDEPAPCFVRFDLVPEAGASTVSIRVVSDPGVLGAGVVAPTTDEVRDLVVAAVNRLSGESNG